MDGCAFFNSQLYAVNPMSEPKMIRYPTASHDRVETAATSKLHHSPLSKLTMSSIAPPEIICIPAVSNDDFGTGDFSPYIEPAAHDIAAANTEKVPSH